jgi:hypothetical protein
LAFPTTAPRRCLTLKVSFATVSMNPKTMLSPAKM